MEKILLRSFFRSSKKILLISFLLLIPVISSAATTRVPSVGPVRFKVAVIGVSVLILFKLLFDSQFNMIEHLFGTNGFSAQVGDKNLRQANRE